jgi:NAD(P)-dependent dehydrogenase (short-subunit alcohol dehydrogenase family)
MTRELAIEWAPHGIRVNAIQPAQVRTPALQALIDDPQFDSDSLLATFLRGIPAGRLVEPDEVAAAALFLASDAASMVTGILLPVDGGNLAMNAGGTVKW